jgi:hypothetical protein
MIYTSGEFLKALAEIAHFGQHELSDVTPSWKITDATGSIRYEGKLSKTNIPIGNGFILGKIDQQLQATTRAEKLTLTLEAAGFQNNWDFWIYPSAIPEIGRDILVTRKLDAHALDMLNKGGKVLLTLAHGSLKPEYGGNIAVGFSSIFWNTAWTGKQAPHTLGILCNPKHPALADFPTEFHSNWQWWDAMSHSGAIDLRDFPAGIKPIVRVIDDWFTNRPLALVFEAKAGQGKILISGIDLQTDLPKRPEARQLFLSLRKYMLSEKFNPQEEITEQQIAELVRK